MYPKIGVFETYSLLMFLGVVLAILVLFLVLKRNKVQSEVIWAYVLLSAVSIFIGILGAIFTQFISDIIKDPTKLPELGMTFYGGIIFGAATFILGGKFIVDKKYPSTLLKVVQITPISITLAHFFGRLGCFCAGCCYGKETDSFWGIYFPNVGHKCYPTQLFEAAFLLILCVALTIIYLKEVNVSSFGVYLVSYGIFRFLIEFIRGDDRGAFVLSLSPAQWISILLFALGTFLIVYQIKRKKELYFDSKEFKLHWKKID